MQVVVDIWNSFRRLPLWVQIWMLVLLIPVNLATLVFLGEPLAVWIAALAVLGMAFNIPIMLAERGMGKAMAIPHIVLWTPAVLLALWVLNTEAGASQGYVSFLVLFVLVDLISLGFDYKDGLDWLRGDRGAV